MYEALNMGIIHDYCFRLPLEKRLHNPSPTSSDDKESSAFLVSTILAKILQVPWLSSLLASELKSLWAKPQSRPLYT